MADPDGPFLVTLRCRGTSHALAVSGAATVGVLKALAHAQFPALPAPARQRLICHGRVAQDADAIHSLHGALATCTVNMLLIEASSEAERPGRLERYRHTFNDAVENAHELFSLLWHGAWKDALRMLGRNVALFFTTLVTQPDPRGRRGQPNPPPPPPG
mmetsp:Transcript_5592/g.14612  ORF Transcript_5592/g.14612 Transcript_5592/m.14612 type:complete len:159 (+) Transcript_5592:3-479(+)